MSNALQELTATVKQLAAQVESRALAPADRSAQKGALATGAPFVTTGPVGEDSRGFMVTKAIAASRGLIPADQAKPEFDAIQQFKAAVTGTASDPLERESFSFLVPLGSDLLEAGVRQHKGYQFFKSMWGAGANHAEGLDLAERIVKSAQPGSQIHKAAMSYLQDTIGGTLVAPPVQGELIELIRPKECLIAAGARQVPLPPNGRIVFPRQTGPTSFYWVGENTAITESNPTTGQVAMQAKKGGVLVTLPNELLKFASVAADALIRTDVAKSIALGVDYAGLYGTGSAAQPKGLTLFTGTNEVIDYAGKTPAPKGVGTNGNKLRPEDGYRMIGLIEDRNFEFTGWIFRPTMANNINGYRADAAAPEDAAGQFVQGLVRSIADRMPGTNFCGYPVTKSAVVRADQTKGSGTGLTEVFGGQWEHLMVGMYGAVEFASSNVAGNTFAQDQTQIRALVWTDVCPRYEGSFVWYKQLLNQIN